MHSSSKHSTIHQVLEYGTIVAHDEEFGLLVTVNASYFNMWSVRESDNSNAPTRWENVDARAMGDLSLNVPHAVLVSKAEGWLHEMMTDEDVDYSGAN